MCITKEYQSMIEKQIIYYIHPPLPPKEISYIYTIQISYVK